MDGRALVVRRAGAAFGVAAVALSFGCSPDVTGGTRDLDEDACVCDCELGCGPEGPERPEGDDQAAATGSGDTAASGDDAGSGGAAGDGGGGAAADGGGGADADGGGGAGAGGGASVACAAGMSRIAVAIDGAAVESCDVDASLGALNHVTATLADGHTLIVSFTGQTPSEDACVGVAMRRPGNTSSENDWQSGDGCELGVSSYGDRVIGTFAAVLAPVSDVALGERVLTAGELDLAR